MRRLALVSSAALAAAVAAAAPALAQTPTSPPGGAAVAVTAGVRDPYEHTNRKIYDFNRGLDRTFLRPPTVFYHHAVWTPVRKGVHNMLQNLTGPIIFVNDVLQGRPTNAATTLSRFVINSTFGVGGIGDPAAKSGLDYHNADFGMTLARYGVPSGPYLFLPVLGPATVRDLAGRGVDSVADPFNAFRYDARVPLGVSRTVAGGVDARDGAEPILKDIDKTATDPYVTIRSLYLQSRDAEIRGAPATQESVNALPDIGPAPAPGAAPTPAPSPVPPPPAPAPNTAPRAALDGEVPAPAQSAVAADPAP